MTGKYKCANCGNAIDNCICSLNAIYKEKTGSQLNAETINKLEAKIREMTRLLLVSRARSNYNTAQWNNERAEILNLKR